jgi:hypothetical protein
MTPDNNKVHFLTNVTSFLIPQRMNSFKRRKSSTFDCHLWLSPRLHFPAIAILTNSLILFSIIVYCFTRKVPMNQNLFYIFLLLAPFIFVEI